MRGWLYGLFFLSGVSALIYELIWQRLLNLVFGVSTLAVSAVLAAFMGGLALGGLLFGRLADRTARPLRLYAWLEGAIGGCALLVPPAFALLISVYTALYSWLQPGIWGGACLRFVLALVVLLIPATLIGGTLPVMGRLAARPGARLTSGFSLLYGINTLGAVLGAALTGFVLLRFLGMGQTLWVAVGINLLVALVAGLLSRAKHAVAEVAHFPGEGFALEKAAPEWRPTSDGRDSGATVGRWMAVGCAACTGATSLGFEVAWTRILGIFTSNSAYAFALVLSVMLLGLGLGSLVQSWWSRWPGNSWKRLAVAQWLLAGVTLASFPFFRTAPAWLDGWCDGTSTMLVFWGELLLTTSALFLPAVLMGMSFPLLAAPLAANSKAFGVWLGRIYAVNTLGGVVGAFLTGFVLVPALGIQNTIAVLVAGNLVVGLAAWGWGVQPFPFTLSIPRRGAGESKVTAFAWRLLPAIGVILLAGIAWACMPAGEFLKSAVRAPRRLLYYREGNNATVSVVEERDGSRSIMVDGQPVAGTIGTSVIDQKMLAHLPLLLHPEPRRALTVGFGSGGTSYSMSLHGIEVDCVEIERAVPAAARYFHSENQGILNNPHFHLILDDARSWLRVAPVRYDAIVTDCTNIQYKSNGDLYTVEYFRLMKERLTPQGVAAAWVPANGIGGADLKTLVRSFRTVFPHTSIWFMNTLATDFLIVVGTPGELAVDLDSWQERMGKAGVRQDLEAVGLADPCRLAYTCLAAGTDLDAYLGAGPLNSDDQPVLSYTTYGATFQRTIATNLIQLLACRGDVCRFVLHPAPQPTMLRHYAASTEAVLGHIEHQAGKNREALDHYLKGAELLQEDPAFRQLVVATYFASSRVR
jgi:spermidine synthase